MNSEENEMLYKEKYLKYKQKYLELKQEGGLVYLNNGQYLFLYNTDGINTNTPLLKMLEDNDGSLKNTKVDLTKIGNEITNEGLGYYFQKGTKKAILFKSFSGKLLKKTKNLYKTATGKEIRQPDAPLEIPLQISDLIKNNMKSIADQIITTLSEKGITINRVLHGTVGWSGHDINNYYKY